MKKLLPVNNNTFFRSFPAYCYFDIITNNILKTGKILASLEIKDFIKDTWDSDLKDSHIDVNVNESINFIVDPYSSNTRMCLYRQCRKDDEIIVKTEHQLPTNPWDGLCIFLNPTNDDSNVETPIYYLTKFYSLDFSTGQPLENNLY
jgi:hypothetical protein